MRNKICIKNSQIVYYGRSGEFIPITFVENKKEFEESLLTNAPECVIIDMLNEDEVNDFCDSTSYQDEAKIIAQHFNNEGVRHDFWFKCVSCGEQLFTMDDINGLGECPMCNPEFMDDQEEEF